MRDSGRHAALVKAIDRAAAAGSIREDLRTALDALRQIVDIQDRSVSEPSENSRHDETVRTGALFTQAVVLYARATETQGDRPKLLGEANAELEAAGKADPGLGADLKRFEFDVDAFGASPEAAEHLRA